MHKAKQQKCLLSKTCLETGCQKPLESTRKSLITQKLRKHYEQFSGRKFVTFCFYICLPSLKNRTVNMKNKTRITT